MNAEAAHAREEVLWQQGDYALNVGGFLFADKLRSADDRDAAGEAPYLAAFDDTKVVGLVLVSQTCDIVNGLPYIAVCPLIEANQEDLGHIQRGTKPSIVAIEHSPAPHVFADLSMVMSVSRDYMLEWNREAGFSDPAKRRRFASAIERKFGRFAFPDEVQRALSKLRDRINQKHKSPDSDVGKIYRSIIEIRLRANPSWSDRPTRISMIAVLADLNERPASLAAVQAELAEQCKKIVWPAGFEWDPDHEECFIGAAGDVTAKQLYESQALDLHYLS